VFGGRGPLPEGEERGVRRDGLDINWKKKRREEAFGRKKSKEFSQTLKTGG